VVGTSSLNHVLSIDKETKTALVEPNVPMDTLVKATLEYNLIPPVVLEFPGITVGGAFSGTSGESSSFKYGFFDKTITSIEIVLADGSIVTASPTGENADLFLGAAGSFGTLGVTTLLELRLIEAKPYVELTYLPVPSVAEVVRKLEKLSHYPDLDFLDAIMFSKNSGTIIGGKLTTSPQPSFKTQTFSSPSDPWFYLHAQAQPNTTVAVPLTDYLFRYDRGAFWTGFHAFKYFKVPFNSMTRWILDYFMHTRKMYHALHESGHTDHYILQDLVLPHTHAEEFIRHIDSELGIYPLWLCPLKKLKPEERSFHPHAGTDDFPINIGVWAPGPTDEEEFVKVNRGLEGKLRELGGMRWLYAQVFQGEEEFWGGYDREGYEALRKKYNVTSLPNVYDKVKRTVRTTSGIKSVLFKIWPLSGLYGVWRSFLGGDYLVARDRSGVILWGPLIALLVGIFAVLA
jgi:FAD/FMN-containing dehydrogenase